MFFYTLLHADQHRASFEKRASEAADQVRESGVLLERRQRDVAEVEGRLKYAVPGAMPEGERRRLQSELAGLREQVSTLERDRVQREAVAADVEFALQSLKCAREATLGEMRRALGSAAAAGSVAGGEGGDAASLRDVVEKVLHELAAIAELRLTLHEGVGDGVPHFTSWEQRTSAAVAQARSTVHDATRAIARSLESFAAAFPVLARDDRAWTDFASWIDTALRRVLADVVARGAMTWHRQISGRGSREMFSVNLKLGSSCRPVFVPPVADLAKLVGDVIEQAFTICPDSSVCDLLLASNWPTALPAQKGTLLAHVRADSRVKDHLEGVKLCASLTIEDIVAFATACEDAHQHLWQPGMTAMPIAELQRALDVLQFDFVNRAVVRGAVVVNAFPLQDAVVSMCTTQLAKLCEHAFQAHLADGALRALMKETTLADTTRPLPQPSYSSLTRPLDVKALLTAALRDTPPTAATSPRQSRGDASPPSKAATRDDHAPAEQAEEPTPAAAPGAPPQQARPLLGVPRAGGPTTSLSPRPSTTPVSTRPAAAQQQQQEQQQEQKMLTPQKLSSGSAERDGLSPATAPPPPPPLLSASSSSASAAVGGGREGSGRRVWESPEKPPAARDGDSVPSEGSPQQRQQQQQPGGTSPYSHRAVGSSPGGGGTSPVTGSESGAQYGQRAKPRRIAQRGATDSDEAVIQRLLQRERETLDRLKRQKETEAERRARAEAEAEAESAVMAAAQRQAALDHAWRESAEQERIRAREEAERRTAEEQLRLEAELERRLDEEMRRRAEQQQRDRAAREEAARVAELKRVEEMEALRLAEAARKKAPSPPSSHSSAASGSAPTPAGSQPAVFVRRASERAPLLPPPGQTASNASVPTGASHQDSALRRKLALPPVTPRSAAAAGPEDAGAPGGDQQAAVVAAGERKPSTAPASTASHTTPRGAAALGSRPILASIAPTATAAAAGSGGGGTEQRAVTASEPQSLLDAYRAYCSECGIKPNSGLLKTLPRHVGEFATAINLDLNYIGVRGVQPLLHVLKRNRGLRLLNLKDNNLENNEVRALVAVLMSESGSCLQHLDLSNNPISLAGGSALMDLVTHQRTLSKVVLRGTLIQPKVVEGIVRAAEANATTAQQQSS